MIKRLKQRHKDCQSCLHFNYQHYDWEVQRHEMLSTINALQTKVRKLEALLEVVQDSKYGGYDSEGKRNEGKVI